MLAVPLREGWNVLQHDGPPAIGATFKNRVFENKLGLLDFSALGREYFAGAFGLAAKMGDTPSIGLLYGAPSGLAPYIGFTIQLPRGDSAFKK